MPSSGPPATGVIMRSPGRTPCQSRPAGRCLVTAKKTTPAKGLDEALPGQEAILGAGGQSSHYVRCVDKVVHPVGQASCQGGIEGWVPYNWATVAEQAAQLGCHVWSPAHSGTGEC